MYFLQSIPFVTFIFRIKLLLTFLSVFQKRGGRTHFEPSFCFCSLSQNSMYSYYCKTVHCAPKCSSQLLPLPCAPLPPFPRHTFDTERCGRLSPRINTPLNLPPLETKIELPVLKFPSFCSSSLFTPFPYSFWEYSVLKP